MSEVGPTPSGNSKILLIAGIIAGLLLGGGGVAAYFLLVVPPTATAAGEAGAPAAADKNAAKTIFIRIDRLSAPLVDGERVVGYVLLDLSLELASSNELLVVQHIPSLRDALLREVTRESISRPNQPLAIDFDSLTERLRVAANQELGSKVVMRVLVTQSTRL